MSIETLLKGYSSKNYLEGMEHQFIIFLLVGESCEILQVLKGF